MRLSAHYDLIRTATTLDETRANAIVQEARPSAAGLLRPETRPSGEAPGALPVVARLVEPSVARGGSVIPAWPLPDGAGGVTIEFVADWGGMLAAWCATLDDGASEDDAPAAGRSGSADARPDVLPGGLDPHALVRSGARVWVGIANDVLQLFVPNPPAGTYSMVRHHALMLGAATLWLGAERAAQWQCAHTAVARAFLRRSAGHDLWATVTAAEQGLPGLLADPRAHGTAAEVVGWLDADPAAAAAFRDYLGAASLGIAALLATAPATGDPAPWLHGLVYDEHPSPDFNRDRVESFAAAQPA
jgi:hypothetical protein